VEADLTRYREVCERSERGNGFVSLAQNDRGNQLTTKESDALRKTKGREQGIYGKQRSQRNGYHDENERKTKNKRRESKVRNDERGG